MSYGYFKRLEFLRGKEIVVSRNAIAKSNIVSQKAHAKFSPRVYGEARYLKILWWKSWKEKPLARSNTHD
jgi:hypothetical protein